MEKVRVFVRDLAKSCRVSLSSETAQECGSLATSVTRGGTLEVYTCSLHTPDPTPHTQTLGVIELPVTQELQAAINSLERRLDWAMEDMGSSAQKIAEKLLDVLPRLRETSPVVAIELLDAFSFAWDDRTDKYIEESVREQEAEEQSWEQSIG